MSCSDTKCKTIETPDGLDAEGDPIHHKCKNSKGEHLNNVDIEICQMASGKIRVFVHAIIDDPKHGAPYEDTGREILSVGTKVLDLDIFPSYGQKHEQSWASIESDGWGDSDDRLHHLPAKFQDFVKATAEAGLALVRSVDA